MARKSLHPGQPLANRKPTSRRGEYLLAARSRDGRPRCERFTDAAAYRARLDTLKPAEDHSLTIDDIISLLDA